MVAAVSGGADSTALLLVLRDQFDVVAAHVNHHLRGAESDDDEAFVRDLCARLQIELIVADGTLDREAIKRSGIEAAAREVRTRRLLEIKERTGARFIATAHQKNDQAETVLMRLFTGSGIAGLRGIHPIRDDGFVRPLLDVARAEIDSFLHEHSVVARVDSSNADPRFVRNRIRATLRDYDEGVIDNLAEVANNARAEWPVIEKAIDAVESVEASDDETRFVTLPDDAWLRQSLLLRHIRRLDPHSREVGATDLARIAAQLDGVRRISVTKELELVRRDGFIVLRKKPQAIDDFEVAIAAGEEISIPHINSVIRVSRANGNGQPFQLPRGADAHFVVRNRRDGDRFRPLGLGGEKKLKDLLIDRKIPVEIRDRIPLLVWNDRIVWVAGVEISDDFKLTDGDADRYEAAVQSRETP
jgi:tRNA(Ile)-lysidine synthase